MSAALFHGLSHVDVAVSNLERALALYSDVLGFALKRRGDGWADLDAGSCVVRLLATRRVERPATVRVLAPDVGAAVEALRAAGATVLYEPMRTPECELVATVCDVDRNTILVWRELSEDEYTTVPELPTQMVWQPEAEAFLKSLLLSVPAMFRALARRKAVRLAEELSATTKTVTREQVIRAYILSSAKVTRYRLRQPLIEHGVDLEKYAAEFDD